jgi:hypothetical protein
MRTKPIYVMQLNTNRKNLVSHTILNDYIDRFDIILTSEPWRGDVGNGVQGPVAHHAWTPLLPVGTVKQGQRPGVMAYVKQRKDFTVTLRSDIAEDLDIQILDVQQKPHPTTMIVNIYSSPKGRGSRCRRTDAAQRLQ